MNEKSGAKARNFEFQKSYFFSGAIESCVLAMASDPMLSAFMEAEPLASLPMLSLCVAPDPIVSLFIVSELFAMLSLCMESPALLIESSAKAALEGPQTTARAIAQAILRIG